MGSNGGAPVMVLYKVINSDSDADDPHFNAFPLPAGGGRATLATVKQNCAALYGLNHLGPEGYHWRVCVEDKAIPGDTGPKTFSWWDIQDDNATLPVKEAPQHQLNKFFGPPRVDDSDIATKAAKGAFKSFGKAVSHAVGVEEHTGPPIKVIAFKLLDLVKMHDDFEKKNHGRGGQIPQPVQQQQNHRSAPRPASSRPPQQAPQRASAPARTHQQNHQQQQQQQRPPQTRQQPQAQRQQRPAEASLMDFGAAPSNGHSLNHASSMPSSFNNKAHANETNAEKLKREYAKKNQNAQRVWDPIDERWVEVGDVTKKSAPNAPPAKKEVGISLDPANAVGKSANVQAAVNSRVNEMKQSQAKALQEVRQREEKKAKDEAEEDEVRKRLTPKIKAWSEEHGKKKQLRALLASLHTILWAGAKWKQVTIGDLLDDKKVKLAFHKASRVVHPDKTHHLDAEKRFLAKRIFDALSQAKTEFDG